MSDVFGAGQAVSGVAQAAGSVAGAALQADASKEAARIATDSANRSADLVQSRYQTTRADLQPYQQTGQRALTYAEDMIPAYRDPGTDYVQGMGREDPAVNITDLQAPENRLNANVPTMVQNSVIPGRVMTSQTPGSMSQAELEATPGYQFTLEQGLRATQNSAAARGLGVSGAALKGAATFATGLANKTYQDQFAIKQQQFQDAYNQDNQQFGQGNTIFNAQLGQDAQNFGQQGNIFSAQQSKDAMGFTQDQTRYSDKLTQLQASFQQQQQRFSNQQAIGTFDQQGRTNSANRLGGLYTLGENAGAMTGSAGASAANSAGNYLTSGASGAAAGALAGGNAWAGGLNGIANAFSQYQARNALTNGSGGGSGAGMYANNGTGYANDGTPTGQGYYGSGGQY